MFEMMKEQVLIAERALLYTLGFNFRIEKPYQHITHRSRPPLPLPVLFVWTVVCCLGNLGFRARRLLFGHIYFSCNLSCSPVWG